ncbi:anaerobic C4-dicarboxylate transporter family protein [Cardinium endosymbiont of Culicoides punctatus]|uniref:anaerobic C4-dicarboxylate transporter family protein n=1 Tax=Cardinium endosymbiont of Culicoides punctatus TaxID=2304601 RepID=UPI001058D788|nr:anaerobic C4-dicarboxylate transporter family protein [Cardinium endosymbiont of Culicoides punctatus]TDG95186.1 hypothetical protein CCPUN_06070 [Cardinium endosymbiont of Culicoides punctatus]
MAIIGWIILVLVLIIGFRLGGIAMGLLSGLGLLLLIFSGYVRSVSPPSELMILQASWLIFNATLDAVGFFHFLNENLKKFLEKYSRYTYSSIIIFCYCLAFITGDRKYFNKMDSAIRNKLSMQQLVMSHISIHMASLVSPLSVSGIILLLVLRNNALPILDIFGMVISITVSIIVFSGIILYFIPCKWSKKLDQLFELYGEHNQVSIVQAETNLGRLKQHNYILLFLLLCLVQTILLSVKPQTDGLTGVIYCNKIFLIQLPMFLALILLAVAALSTLYWKIKPAKIVGSNRFKIGIQQFFIFFGLVWLVETLVDNDKILLGKILKEGIAINNYSFYYLVYFFCLLFMDAPIIIWVFAPLFISNHFSFLNIALMIISIYVLSIIRSCMVAICRKRGAHRHG